MTPSGKTIVGGKLIDTDSEKAVEFQYVDGAAHVFNVGYKQETVDEDTVRYSPIFVAAYSAEGTTDGPKTKHPLVPVLDVQGYALVKRFVDSEIAYPSMVTLRDIAIVTPEGRHSLQGSMTVVDDVFTGNARLTTGKVSVDLDGVVGGSYPDYKLTGTVNVLNAEPSATTIDDGADDYEQTSKFANALNSVKSLNLRLNQELRVESPYRFVSNNRLQWDDDNLEINGDFLIDENDEFTMYGNVSTTGLLDLMLNGERSISYEILQFF